MTYHETSKQRVDLSRLELKGRTLDIGGGGEGIIARHIAEGEGVLTKHGEACVIAIDNRADELSDAPDAGIKIIMDACDLKFLNGYFDHVTCFYSLMYMDLPEMEKFINEAYRVLKSGGDLWIWDSEIPAEIESDVFVAQVEVKISTGEKISAGYGVGWSRAQDISLVKNLCKDAGLILDEDNENGEAFFLRLSK